MPFIYIKSADIEAVLQHAFELEITEIVENCIRCSDRCHIAMGAYPARFVTSSVVVVVRSCLLHALEPILFDFVRTVRVCRSVAAVALYVHSVLSRKRAIDARSLFFSFRVWLCERNSCFFEQPVFPFSIMAAQNAGATLLSGAGDGVSADCCCRTVVWYYCNVRGLADSCAAIIGEVVFVSVSRGTSMPDCGGLSLPCQSFAAAQRRCSAVGCSQIAAEPGIYRGPGNVNLFWGAGAVSIIATERSGVVLDCGSRSDPGWTVQNGSLSIAGFTFLGCQHALYFIDPIAAMISDCTFANCTGSLAAEGTISVRFSSPSVTNDTAFISIANCLFSENHAMDIDVDPTDFGSLSDLDRLVSVLIDSCVFTNTATGLNSAQARIWMPRLVVRVQYCLFSFGSTGWAGAIDISGSRFVSVRVYIAHTSFHNSLPQENVPVLFLGGATSLDVQAVSFSATTNMQSSALCVEVLDTAHVRLRNVSLVGCSIGVNNEVDGGTLFLDNIRSTDVFCKRCVVCVAFIL